MSTFKNAVLNQEARTTNDMKARQTTASACVDFFFKIGASRGKDIIPSFIPAVLENRDYALRTVAWARDVRGGSGERKLFRDVLLYLEKTDRDAAMALARKVPELGRWDDLLVFTTDEMKNFASQMILEALNAGNGLCAKWMPRKGVTANFLRQQFGWTPKFYRKRLVELTKVVESQMCANDWDNINFSHVPSLASSRYKKAFSRHTPEFGKYVEKLKSGDKSVKVNAAAVYPYDVLKGVMNSYYDSSYVDHVDAQWAALPNYVGNASILPIVDVSGSMTCKAGGHNSKSNVTCLDVSVSLGLYLSEKNKGKFKDMFMTFSSTPKLKHLQGTVTQRMRQMQTNDWGMSTDLNKAIKLVLDTAVKGKVPQEEMPNMLLVLSDMQFNGTAIVDLSAQEMIEAEYAKHGYTVPKIVYWNLNAHDNVPVAFDKSGVALVSGFSPAIVKSVLAAKLEQFTPEGIMLQTIMNERYAV